MPTYARYPLTLVRGEGITVWDDEGHAYLDIVGRASARQLARPRPPRLAQARARRRPTALGLVVEPVRTPSRRRSSPQRLARCCRCPRRACSSATRAPRPNEAAIKLAPRAAGLAAGPPSTDRRARGRRSTAARWRRSRPRAGAAKRERLRAAASTGSRFVPPNDRGALAAPPSGPDVAPCCVEPVHGRGRRAAARRPRYLRARARALRPARRAARRRRGADRCSAAAAPGWRVSRRRRACPTRSPSRRALGGGLPIGALRRAGRASRSRRASTRRRSAAARSPSRPRSPVLDVIEARGLLGDRSSSARRLRGALVAAAPRRSSRTVRGRGACCCWACQLPVARRRARGRAAHDRRGRARHRARARRRADRRRRCRRRPGRSTSPRRRSRRPSGRRRTTGRSRR